MATSAATITLYSSPISDASARVRIALALKELHYSTVSLRLSERMTETDEFTSINPAQAVPALVVHDASQNHAPTVLAQSNAILEYLDEGFPQTIALLPPLSEPLARAKVRTLVGIIGTDIHPLTVHRVGRELSRRLPAPETPSTSTGTQDWGVYWITRGLPAYESLAAQTAGLYSFGDNITLADLFLIPELWTAMRKGVSLQPFPTITRIYENLMKVKVIANEKHKPELEGM